MSIENNLENIDIENEKIEKDTNQDIKQDEFLKKFIDDKKKNSNKEQTNTFVKDICIEDNITPEIKDELIKFQSENKKEFPNIDIDNIKIEKLRTMLIRDFLRFKSTNDNYILELNKNYTLSKKDIEKLKKELQKKSSNDIEILAKDTKSSEEFLEKTLGKVPEKFEYTDIINGIDGIDSADIEKRLKKVEKNSPEKIEDVKSALGQFANGTFRAEDFEILFEANFLTSDEKKLLLKKYNSSISLSLCVKYGLISELKAKTFKNKFIDEIINKEKISLGNIQKEGIKALKETIKLEDIEINILDLGLSEKEIDKFIIERNGLQKLNQEVEDFKEKTEKEWKESGAKNLKEFKEVIKKDFPENINGIDLFEKGNYIKLTSKDKGEEEENDAIFEIVSNDDNKMGFQYRLIGNKSGVDINRGGEPETVSYKAILTKLQKAKDSGGSMNINFESKEKFLSELNDPNSNIKNSSHESYSRDVLENEEERNKITGSFKEKLIQEIKDLDSEIKKLETESKDSIELKNLKVLRASKSGRLRNLATPISQNDLFHSLNLEKLISDLDSIDNGGKNLGLTKGILLEDKKGGIFEIYGIDLEQETITIKDSKNIVSVSFSDFYKGFEKNELKRTKKLNDFSEVIKELELSPDYRFENGKLIFKNEEKKDQEVNYFSSDSGKEILKIDSIDGDKITIKLGEREKEEDKKTDKTKETLSMQKKSETLTLNEFKNGIKNLGWKPNSEVGKKATPKNIDNRLKGSLWNKYTSRLSVSDCFSAGKFFIENFKEHLKKGSDLASAKLALKTGKFLTDDLRHTLLIRVESFESDEMQKSLDGLKKIDSGDATKKIEKRLRNTDIPSYMIEAGMLFMVENYGHLTAKGPLFPYRKSFLWYQALGGRIGDELYVKEKEKAEREGLPFVEENLVRVLVLKQCKGKGYKGIKRRSRLYKELEGKKGAGVQGELEKGYKDASKKNVVRAMIDGGLNEANSGTTANSIGWFKKVIEKGGTLEEMNEGFFCLLYSGALSDVDGEIYNQIKALYEGEGKPIVLALMSRSVSSIKNTREIILEISERIGKEYPNKHPGIAKEAKEIFDNADSIGGNAEEKFKTTMKFFNKHGKPIINALNMVHTDDTTYAKTDKMILLEKNKNQKFENYVGLINELTHGGTFDKDLMIDEVGKVGITGLKPIVIVQKYLGLNSSGNKFDNTKVAGIVWEKNINKDIKSTKDKIFESGGTDVNSPKNREIQKEYLRGLLRTILGGIKGVAARGNEVNIYNKLPFISKDLKARGLDPLSENLGTLSGDEIAKGDDPIANKNIEKAIDKILAGATAEEATNDATDLFKGMTAGVLDKKETIN